MNSKVTLFLFRAAFALVAGNVHSESVPAVVTTQPEFKFEVTGEERLAHTFLFKNQSGAELRVRNVSLHAPFLLEKASSTIPAGGQGFVTVRFSGSKAGHYKSPVTVEFDNSDAEDAAFSLSGTIHPYLECTPGESFFVEARRGETETASIGIINREPEPLEIKNVQHDSTRFVVTVKTIEPGKRYSLTLRLRKDAPAGRAAEPITLLTSSRHQPTLRLMANTIIQDRVYTSPDAVDLGLIRKQDLTANPAWIQNLSQTLMIYQQGGRDFQVNAETILPFLKLSTERSQTGDRCEVKLDLLPEKLPNGRAAGTIILSSNDKDFSRVEVPVTAIIED